MENRRPYLPYNLQYFAKDGPGGEKTEPATGKKLKEAREEGQVVKSNELTSAIGLISLFLTLKYFISYIGNGLISTFELIYGKIPDIVKEGNKNFTWQSAASLQTTVLVRILLVVAPVFLISFIVAVLVDLLQVRWKPTTKPLKPKLNKLNPMSGFKKILSKQSLFELVKSIGKISLIAYVSYSILKDKQNQIYILYDIPLFQAIELVGSLAIDIGLRVSIVYLIIGIADYIYQFIKFKNDMKMTKQEIKDEYKNTEGNPEIKGRQKSKMREVSRQRMMQDVPKADVVITNPTHLSVAIMYDSDTLKAPMVVAKGEDFLALKIREIAKENEVEIVENKPLARMLYANVDIGGEVPPELYQAVAEVLAFVYNLKNKS